MPLSTWPCAAPQHCRGGGVPECTPQLLVLFWGAVGRQHSDLGFRQRPRLLRSPQVSAEAPAPNLTPCGAGEPSPAGSSLQRPQVCLHRTGQHLSRCPPQPLLVTAESSTQSSHSAGAEGALHPHPGPDSLRAGVPQPRGSHVPGSVYSGTGGCREGRLGPWAHPAAGSLSHLSLTQRTVIKPPPPRGTASAGNPGRPGSPAARPRGPRPAGARSPR